MQPMYVTAAWIEAHCVIPDGDHRGEPFELSNEQLRFVLGHYTVRPTAKFGEKAAAFEFRISLLVRAQKWGKSPLIAAFVCLEAVGPATFAGFASGGEVYDCRDFGCGCGWVYEYDEGEPMGVPWPTPLIQITATSEEQTDNTYDALRPMINDGPLTELMPKTGEEFIRLPNGGRIDVVTSKANSRLGQRTTFAPQDETGLWLPSNGGLKLARTQRRGLAGMGGRSIQTTNAWNPAEDSEAQRTFESTAEDIQKDFRQPPADLSFGNKRDRKKLLKFNYEAAPWVNIADIEAEAADLISRGDAADAERFFGNRIVAGAGHWIADSEIEAHTGESSGELEICLGFDGSDSDDWTGIRAETRGGFQFTPTYGPDNRPTVWNPAEWGGKIPRSEVDAAVDELFSKYRVSRMYCDPPGWQSEIEAWALRHGAEHVLEWATYRPRQMHESLIRFTTDLGEGNITLDQCPSTRIHFLNARKIAKPGQRYMLGKPSHTQKIDLAMCSVLAHEAAADARASGWGETQKNYVWML